MTLEFAPRPSAAAGPPPASHLVCFHDDGFTPEPVAELLCGAAAAPEGLLVIATPEHRAAIAQALAGQGLDARALAAAGQLVELDARRTLELVAPPGGTPSADLLRRHVGAAFDRLEERFGAVAAYGEIVDLLAGDDRLDDAVALEAAWDELLAGRPARLLCGYALAAFDDDVDGGALRRVCTAHQEVLPAHRRPAADAPSLEVELRQRNRLLERLYRQAEGARQAAERANRAKDELLTVLGHELRNPLAPIVTSLQLMKLRGDGQLAREREVLERQVTHLHRLVEDLLDVSRITHGRLEIERSRLEVAELVAQAIETTAPLFEQRAHRLEVEVPPNGLAVDGDGGRLAQVVANLLSNAAKFTPPGGRVAVAARAEDDEVVLSVRDSGIGMPPELVANVFDSFVQGRRSPEAQAGLGLGLAIVRGLVEAHGGTVAAASPGAGQGCEVTVRLPRAAARRERLELVRPAAPERSERQPRRLRVLVVDDNVDAARGLAELVEHLGCETHLAYDGATALLVAQETSPHLVLLDLGLPVMSGHEVAAHLRGFPCGEEMRIVAVTGFGQAADRERSLAAGCDEHWVKPLPIDALRATVEELAERQLGSVSA